MVTSPKRVNEAYRFIPNYGKLWGKLHNGCEKYYIFFFPVKTCRSKILPPSPAKEISIPCRFLDTTNLWPITAQEPKAGRGQSDNPTRQIFSWVSFSYYLLEKHAGTRKVMPTCPISSKLKKIVKISFTYRWIHQTGPLLHKQKWCLSESTL